MKLLHVIPSVSPGDGGPSRAIVDIERALSARGMEVTTVTTVGAADIDALGIACGVPIKAAGVTRWYFRRNASFYKVSLPLASWLKRRIEAFDVVHAHALFSFAPIAAAFFARRAGVPYVLRPLGVLNRYGMTEHHAACKRLSLAMIEGPLIAGAAAVHFTSRAEAAEAERLRLRCRGVVIPLGIDRLAAPRQGALRGDDAERPTLLFLSRIDRKKNLEGLLGAVSRLCARHPGLTLDVVGDGERTYVGELKSLAAKLGISDRVRWHGYLADEAKDRIIAAATAFVLPSFSENFGIAVVEALAAGLPCIVSREVAVSDEIEAAGAGIVVGTDAASIAAGIDYLLAQTDRQATFRLSALKLAAEAFSLSAMGERLERLYLDITAGRARQAAAWPPQSYDLPSVPL